MESNINNVVTNQILKNGLADFKLALIKWILGINVCLVIVFAGMLKLLR